MHTTMSRDELANQLEARHNSWMMTESLLVLAIAAAVFALALTVPLPFSTTARAWCATVGELAVVGTWAWIRSHSNTPSDADHAFFVERAEQMLAQSTTPTDS